MDTLGHNVVGGSVGLFKCHDSGGNQVCWTLFLHTIFAYYVPLFLYVLVRVCHGLIRKAMPVHSSV